MPIKISICIPTYNHSAHLANCLQSIVSNNERSNMDFEVCVSDNCSTDDTEDVVRRAQQSVPITYSKNDRNLGAPQNYLNVVKIAKGEFIWLIGDDDLLLQNAIKKVCKMISDNEFVDYFFINTYHLSSDYVFSCPQPFSCLDLPAKMKRFSSWKKTGEMRFMELIDPKISFDFLGGIYLSVFRRNNWMSHANILAKEALLDNRLFSHFDNTFPHIKIFSKAFSNSKAYIHAEPLSVSLSGARHWSAMYSLVRSVRLLEALREYRKNGLPIFRYIMCKNYALRYFVPDFLSMLINRKSSGFFYVKPFKLVVNNLLYPGLYFSVVYYFIRKLKPISNWWI